MSSASRSTSSYRPKKFQMEMSGNSCSTGSVSESSSGCSSEDSTGEFRGTEDCIQRIYFGASIGSSQFDAEAMRCNLKRAGKFNSVRNYSDKQIGSKVGPNQHLDWADEIQRQDFPRLPDGCPKCCEIRRFSSKGSGRARKYGDHPIKPMEDKNDIHELSRLSLGFDQVHRPREMSRQIDISYIGRFNHMRTPVSIPVPPPVIPLYKELALLRLTSHQMEHTNHDGSISSETDRNYIPNHQSDSQNRLVTNIESRVISDMSGSLDDLFEANSDSSMFHADKWEFLHKRGSTDRFEILPSMMARERFTQCCNPTPDLDENSPGSRGHGETSNVEASRVQRGQKPVKPSSQLNELRKRRFERHIKRASASPQASSLSLAMNEKNSPSFRKIQSSKLNSLTNPFDGLSSTARRMEDVGVNSEEESQTSIRILRNDFLIKSTARFSLTSSSMDLSTGDDSGLYDTPEFNPITPTSSVLAGRAKQSLIVLRPTIPPPPPPSSWRPSGEPAEIQTNASSTYSADTSDNSIGSREDLGASCATAVISNSRNLSEVTDRKLSKGTGLDQRTATTSAGQSSASDADVFTININKVSSSQGTSQNQIHLDSKLKASTDSRKVKSSSKSSKATPRPIQELESPEFALVESIIISTKPIKYNSKGKQNSLYLPAPSPSSEVFLCLP